MIRLEVDAQIGGAKIDLDTLGNTDFKINRSANDVREITRRKGSRSQEFTLPFSQTNNQFFNHFYDVDAVGFNFSPSIKTIARVYDGASLEIEGYLKLQDVNRTKQLYKVVVVDGFVDFSTALGDATLDELFLNDASLDHVLSRQQILDSWGAGLFNLASERTLDIYYPLIDWGYNWSFGGSGFAGAGLGINSEFNPIFVEQFRPAIKHKAILSRIFARAGFVWDSDFIDGYEKYMTLSNGSQIVPSGVQVGFEAKISADQNIPANAGTVINFGATNYNNGGGFSVANDEFTCQTTGEHFFSVRISGTGTLLTYLDFTINVDMGSGYNLANTNGSDLQTFFDTNTVVLYNFNGGASPITGSFDATFTFKGNMVIGHKLQIKVFHASQNDDDFILESNNVLFSLYQAPPLIDGSTIRISQNMYSDIKQIDYIRAFFERYNLWAEPSKGIPNQLIIEPYEQFFEGGTIRDITAYVDQSSDIVVKPMSDFRAKKLLFQDLASDNFLNELYTSLSRRRYGSKEVETKDQFAQGVIEVFSIFEPATHYKIKGSEILTVANYKRNDVGEFIPRAARPMTISKVIVNQSPSTYFWIYDRVAANATQVTTTYGKALSFDGNNPFTDARLDDNFQLDTYFFQQQIRTRSLKPDTYTKYWLPMIQETYSDETKLYSCKVVLPKGFVSQLRMADTLRIKTTNFRINNLQGYTSATGEATLELIKRTADIDNVATCDVIPNAYNLDGTISFINPTTGASASPTRKCCELVGGTFATVGDSSVCLWRDGKGQGDGGVLIPEVRSINLTSNTTITTSSESAFFWPTGLDYVVLSEGTWSVKVDFIGNDGNPVIYRYEGIVLVSKGVHSGSFTLVLELPASNDFAISVGVITVGIRCSGSSVPNAVGNFKINASKL